MVVWMYRYRNLPHVDLMNYWMLKIGPCLFVLMLIFFSGCGPDKAVDEVGTFCEMAISIENNKGKLPLEERQAQLVQSIMKMSLSSKGHKFITDLASSGHIDYTFFEAYAMEELGMQNYECPALQHLFPK